MERALSCQVLVGLKLFHLWGNVLSLMKNCSDGRMERGGNWCFWARKGSRMWPHSPKQRVRGMVLFRLVAAECFFLIWNLGVKPGDAHSMRLEMLESIQKAGWQGGAQEQCWMRGWILQTTCKVRIWAGQDFFALTDSCGRVDASSQEASHRRENHILHVLCFKNKEGQRLFFTGKAAQQVIWKTTCYLPVFKVSGKGRPHAVLLGVTEPRRQWKVNRGQIDNKPMYCPFR